MHFSGVDVPLELLDAHEAGRLVLFIGAGVSMGAPTNLPSFSKLAIDVAADFGVDISEASGSEDLILGQLDDDPQQDVHMMVQRHIMRAEQGNALHEALARLSLAGPAPKVVTTNYDQFLSLALAKAGAELEEFRAPALPMGDDFVGVVYLHGSVNQDPRKLVLTDKDFGRAYLSDAWAARYLERMFHEYVVCFVGYSHRDLVLSYLARGLRPGSKRYAFTSEGASGSPRWASLGIVPILYEDTDNTHQQLLTAVQDWGNWSASGLLDKHERVREMTAHPPTGIPEEDDFLEKALDDDVIVRAFCATAKGREWLDWIATKDAFSRLTQASQSTFSMSQTALANWFAKNFVVADSESMYALSLLRNHQGPPSQSLWRAVCMELMEVTERQNWVTPWVFWLLDHLNSDVPAELDELAWLVAEAKCLSTADVLVVLEELLKPRPRTRRWMLDGGTEYVVEVSLTWMGLLRERLSGLTAEPSSAFELLRILEGTMHGIFVRNHSISGSDYDTWAFSRRSIEDSPQNGIDESADFVIDLARDCIICLAKIQDRNLDGNVSRWITGRVPMLRRLAIFGFRQRSDATETEKLEWLLGQPDRQLLFEPQLRYESLQLIRAAYPKSEQSTRLRLVDVAIEGSQAEQPYRDYDTHDLLTWLLTIDPHLPKAQRAVADLREKYPELGTKPHANLDGGEEDAEWAMSTTEPAWSEEYLHGLINDDPASAASHITRGLTSSSPSNHSASGATHQVAAVVSRWPDDGFQLWEHALNEPRFVASIITGWAGSPSDTPLAQQIIGAISALDLEEFGPAVASLLRPRASNQTAGPPWPTLPAARDLALAVWPNLERSPTTVADQWGSALNSSDGSITEFWIEALRHDWRSNRDDWDGIQGQIRNALEAICSPDGLTNTRGWALLISHLRFLHSADSEWTITHVLPILNWRASPVAAGAWTVLVQTTGMNQALLDDGLKSELLTTVERFSELAEPAQRRLSRLAASITVHSLWSPHTKLRWLLDLTRASTSQFCADLIRSIRQQLADATQEVIAKCWNDWMKAYLAARTEGRPRTGNEMEASALAEWVEVLATQQSIEKAIEYICLMPAALSFPTGVRKIKEDRVRMAPNAYAQLSAHLLKNTDPPCYLGRDLEKLYLILRDNTRVERTHLNAIREQALRLGVEAATDWRA